MRCLFLSPMKPPEHATPSGDRTMSRLLMQLLNRLGYEVDLCSTLRAYLKDGSAAEIDALKAGAAAEVRRILARERSRSDRPAFVFCYHNYYKAPDLIGPALAAALGAPYVVAEASRAEKRASGSFATAHALASASIDSARLVFASTENDRIELARLKSPGQMVVDLKPFTDGEAWPDAIAGERRCHDPLRLLTVAMMRAGNKMRSYEQLAMALATARGAAWTLDIAGEGPRRAEIERLFASFGERIRFHGQVDDRRRMSAIYAQADIFVWPGVTEAFGMVYLEAQAHGLPCVGGRDGGVPDVVVDQSTGLLVPPGDPAALMAAIKRLRNDAPLYARMSSAAQHFAREERTFERAGVILENALRAIGVASARAIA